MYWQAGRNKMSEVCVELTINDIKVQSTSTSSLPLNSSLNFSKYALTGKSSWTTRTDRNPFTVFRKRQTFVLICSIVLMTVILQTPTIVYFTSTPPQTTSSPFTAEVDWKSCSVSNRPDHEVIMLKSVCIILFRVSSNTNI